MLGTVTGPGVTHVEDMVPLLQKLTSEWDGWPSGTVSQPAGHSDRRGPGGVGIEHLEPTATGLPNRWCPRVKQEELNIAANRTGAQRTHWALGVPGP